MTKQCNAGAGALFLIALSGPAMASSLTLEQSGLFTTQGQNMWGPSGSIAIEKDVYAVRTGVLPERSIGEYTEIVNPARAPWEDALAGCQALSAYNGGSFDCTKVTVPGLGGPPPAPTAPTPPDFPRPTGLDALNPFSPENTAWRNYDVAATGHDIATIEYNTVKLPSYNANVTGCAALTSLTRDECVNGFAPLGAAPPETLRDGAELTISDAELELGVRARVAVGDGEVDASQGFTVRLDVPDGDFEEGEEVVIQTAGELGDASLASEFDVVDAGLDALTKLTTTLNVRQDTAGVTTVDTDLASISVQNADGSAVATEVLGMTIGNGGIEGRFFGESGVLDLSEGIGKELRVPAFPDATGTLAKLIGFSAADITGYVPDLDLDEITGQTPLTGDITPGTRSGTGEAPIDFLKADLDMDVFTALNGAPFGVGGGIPLLLDVQLDIGDADIGAFFGITQKQTLEPGTVEVLLKFSTPTEVETAPGSNVFELVSEKMIDVGQDVRIRHPGGDLQVTPEYRLKNARYSNLTQAVMQQSLSMAMMKLGLSGAIPTALGVSGFALFEETFPLGDPSVIGTIFDNGFFLEGFDTVAGSSFVLAGAAGTAPSPVPLPAAAWMFLASLLALWGFRHSRRAD